MSPSEKQPGSPPQLARRLGLFDATMLVMGGIIGSGIFINPYVVARQVNTPFLILGVWAFGGLIALVAAFIWAELAALRPEVGGQYAYLREAFTFRGVSFGWALLLVFNRWDGGQWPLLLRATSCSTRIPILTALSRHWCWRFDRH